MRPTRLLVPVLVALLLALALPATAATPAQRYESTAHTETNKVRVARDVGALKKSRCLQKWARSWAAKLARDGDLDPPHQPYEPVMRDCGLTRYAENVAYGYATGKAVVRQGWMKSAGHRRNILDGRLRLMGIGAKKAHGRWYVAQVFGTK